MNKIGLALSGGGFRATLYHLGLIRFLRDAKVLSQVTHITSVSGGSIFAAHLVLNWERYNGSPNDFSAAAREILTFVQRDVRNRIVRRFPLNMPLRWPRRLLGLSNRRLSRTGLLEVEYERNLLGDTSLFQLPECPRLHILATNLSEGCLCAFDRDGLLMVRLRPDHSVRLDRIHMGLATVPMAVTASSAFPGFFPPLELTGANVGANGGEFTRQAYTDGGVFDNLGVRMFRCLERTLLTAAPLTADDFHDLPRVAEALRQAGDGADSPLRRLLQVVAADATRPGAPPLLPAGAREHPADGDELAAHRLQEVIRNYQLQRDPLFADLTVEDADAELLRRTCLGAGRTLDPTNQQWLNRHLLEAAFRRVTGRPCFRRLNSGLDGVLVSDVGKRIEVQSGRRAGGLIRTALRSTDILMDRVWQLETETFRGTPGFVFVPITDVVEPAEDPTALHPEIQRQVANLRTDLDRFSPLEISSLVRHGYAVGRKACRGRPDLFGTDLPAEAPWDPIPPRFGAAGTAAATVRPDGRERATAPAAVEAPTLRASAVRRIWSRLFDLRDWTSYVYVPILVPILFLLPYMVAKYYQRSARLAQLMQSISQGGRDLELMNRLLDGPIRPTAGETAEEVLRLEPVDDRGFDVWQDLRIIDLRGFHTDATGKTEPNSMVYGYRRLKVVKKPDNTGNSIFRTFALATAPQARIRFPNQQLPPKLRVLKDAGGSGEEKRSTYEISVNFDGVPVGDPVDVIYEHFSPGEFLRRNDGSTTIAFNMPVDTAEVSRWILMPEGRDYRNFRIVRYPFDKRDKVEEVKLAAEYLAEDSTILAYKLLSVKAGYTYELTWYYK